MIDVVPVRIMAMESTRALTATWRRVRPAPAAMTYSM